MTLIDRIHRRLTINKTVRELSRLDSAMLADIGLVRGNLRESVERMVDAKSNSKSVARPVRVTHNYQATSGAAA